MIFFLKVWAKNMGVLYTRQNAVADLSDGEGPLSTAVG